MSAFLVEDRTINKILTHIREEIRKSKGFENKFKTELGITFDENWERKLGQKMLDLNQLALGYRYGDDKQELNYTFSPVLCTPIQAYKALRCWLYQCREGEIPEESKLYKFFDEIVVGYIAKSIITSTLEYRKAEWG